VPGAEPFPVLPAAAAVPVRVRLKVPGSGLGQLLLKIFFRFFQVRLLRDTAGQNETAHGNTEEHTMRRS
jgi:hypothetical protein